jgi:hypothetical protein
MQDGKHNGISFTIYLMMADLLSIFSYLEGPLYTGFSNKNDFIYKLEEIGIPHRISPGAATDLLDDTGSNMIGFPTFTFGVIAFERFYQYTGVDDSIELTITRYLSLLHDKMTPR